MLLNVLCKKETKATGFKRDTSDSCREYFRKKLAAAERKIILEGIKGVMDSWIIGSLARNLRWIKRSLGRVKNSPQ